MKKNDWQLLWYFLLRLLFLFMECSKYGKKYLVILANNFFASFSFRLLQSSWFSLYVYSRLFVKILLLKLLRAIETKKLLVKIVVPKQKSLILLVISVFLLILCIVTSVPSSPQKLKTIWIIIVRRNIAPQKLTLPSSAKFVSTSLQAFTLYANIESVNMVFLSGH